ncbi:hypothetical protein AKJ41_04690 [candidate division MSBL1 archaeon SCGC-AAA259O05]|uniref:Uncharacterized protein n=1 Tax=candidate division MSBL1 archaeon SCGC-AAA259O05 TaxID=1698271 RepID=A0A133V0D0_9EURY|nr:hypothetical protein AKJ41_04690 [candidate division MSBL1 archaeon SCGC-AAA259O05]
MERILEHLGALEEVHEEPSPRRGEIEEYDRPGAELRSPFIEVLEEVGEVPEDETSRKDLLRMASGPKYKAYGEMSDRILEHLDFVTDHLKEMKGRSESLKIWGGRG